MGGATLADMGKAKTPTRWVVSLTFLKGGKYEMRPVVRTFECGAPTAAITKAFQEARRTVMRGKKIDHFTARVARVVAPKGE